MTASTDTEEDSMTATKTETTAAAQGAARRDGNADR